MRWAITPNGVGKPVGFRSIKNDSELKAGEFASTTDPADKVLADDGTSLRDPDTAERLAQIREAKWAKIKERRQQALDNGAQFLGHYWDTEETHLNRMMRTIWSWEYASGLSPQLKATLPGPVPTSINWTTKADVEVSITLDQLKFLLLTCSNHEGVVFEIAKQLRTTINSATNVDVINAIDWPS